MNRSFPDRWSFSYLNLTKYITHIIGEPKYKCGQQEQVTVRNHNSSTALERSVLKYAGGGGLYGIPTSSLGSVVLHYKCNITHITHNNREYEICIYYNPPPIKFVTLINKMNRNRSTALERSVLNYWGLKPPPPGLPVHQP